MSHVHHTARQDNAMPAVGTAPAGRLSWDVHRRLRVRATAYGVASILVLGGGYVFVLAAANSLEHVVTEFVRLAAWMVSVMLGFGLQVGLFTYARGATSQPASASARGVVASSGTSTLSMVACCAHHLTDVLPLIGLAGAAVFLTDYQKLFLLAGVLSNVVGLVYLLGVLRRHGLFPSERSLLSMSVHWPADRALPLVVFFSAVVFLIAILSRTSSP